MLIALGSALSAWLIALFIADSFMEATSMYISYFKRFSTLSYVGKQAVGIEVKRLHKLFKQTVTKTRTGYVAAGRFYLISMPSYYSPPAETACG